MSQNRLNSNKLDYMKKSNAIAKANKRKLKKKLKAARLERFAVKLNKNVPNSERWFRSLYNEHYIHSEDKFNVPICEKYIGDIVNKQFKYVIEIDGSYHDRSDQKLRDAYKDLAITRSGYLIIRVKAYDRLSYLECISKIKSRRETFGLKSNPTTKFNEFVRGVEEVA